MKQSMKRKERTEDEEQNNQDSKENTREKKQKVEGKESQKCHVYILQEFYTRESVKDDTFFLYIFTDNNERTSAPSASEENVEKDSWYYKKYKELTSKPIHYGSLKNPTSALIRGLNNAYPISTMSKYGTNWKEEEFDLFKSVIDDEINQIKRDVGQFKGIKISKHRIGQGGRYARLPLSLQSYLDEKLREIYIDNTGEHPTWIVS